MANVPPPYSEQPPAGYPPYPAANPGYPPANPAYNPGYPGQGYPPAQAGYPPAQGGYADPKSSPYPAGGAVPPPAGYPPAGYSPAGYAAAPVPQQGQQGQTTVVVTGPPVAAGNCPVCRAGFVSEDFTCCGICLAIFCFPLGLICCFLMRERRCSNCGAHL